MSKRASRARSGRCVHEDGRTRWDLQNDTHAHPPRRPRSAPFAAPSSPRNMQSIERLARRARSRRAAGRGLQRERAPVQTCSHPPTAQGASGMTLSGGGPHAVSHQGSYVHTACSLKTTTSGALHEVAQLRRWGADGAGTLCGAARTNARTARRKRVLAVSRSAVDERLCGRIDTLAIQCEGVSLDRRSFAHAPTRIRASRRKTAPKLIVDVSLSVAAGMRAAMRGMRECAEHRLSWRIKQRPRCCPRRGYVQRESRCRSFILQGRRFDTCAPIAAHPVRRVEERRGLNVVLE